MIAFEATTGAVEWEYDVALDGASQFHGTPLVVDSLIVFGTDEGSMETGGLYCLNRFTGAPIWKSLGHSGVASQPAYSGDSIVYVVTRDDTLLAVSKTTGKALWSFYTGWQRVDDYEYPSMIETPKIISSAIVEQEKVIFVGRDSSVYAFDPYTGVRRWATRLDAVRTTPLFTHKGQLILGLSDYTLTHFDIGSGGITRKDTLDYLALGGVSVVGDDVIMLAGYEDARPTEVAAFNLSTKEAVWTTSIRDYDSEVYWYVPRVHHWRDEIVVGSTKGRVVGCDVNTGKWNWHTKLEGPIRGIGHSDSLLYVGTFHGMLYALRVTPSK